MAGPITAHINITWESEPTEEAKNFIRLEVLRVLKEALGEGTWLSEIVEAEVKKYIEDVPMTTVELKTCEEAVYPFEILHIGDGIVALPKGLSAEQAKGMLVEQIREEWLHPCEQLGEQS